MNWRSTSKNIKYDLGPDNYVWGVQHPVIIGLAERANIHGTWLNLAAGDGRYNNLLVDRCQSIIAFDLDEKALHRLVERLPATHRGKIRSVVGDMTAPFPFPAGEFDGCLCTGVLHLFKEPVLRRIFEEIFRVLRPRSSFIMNFAVDIERKFPDGSSLLIDGEPHFTLEEGRRILRDVFREADYELIEGQVSDFPVNNFDCQYIFGCNVLSLLAEISPASGVGASSITTHSNQAKARRL